MMAVLDADNATTFQMVKNDPYLEPFQDSIKARFDTAQKWIENIEQNEGSLENFSKGYEKYGFNIQWVCPNRASHPHSSLM